MEFKKKCRSCGKKIDKKFQFCPWCGKSAKENFKNNYGFLGKDDFEEGGNQMTQGAVPMGNLGKMMNSLMNQLGKEMQNMDGKDFSGVMPKGFTVKIQRGSPQMKRVVKPEEKKEIPINKVQISDKEKERRAKLKRKETVSKVKRLSDKIIYEISAPGIKDASQVEITSLEKGLEIKIYAKDYCYVKIIPVKIKFSKMNVQKDKLILEFTS
jgi:rRNA maturation endonuclease Nob1